MHKIKNQPKPLKTNDEKISNRGQKGGVTERRD